MINTKIKQLKKLLLKVKQTREVQRKPRINDSNLIFSLVGYTNSGKSTIFNNLSSSNVLVKDMVFTTLDTKMSLVNLSNKKKIILSDTVGFISALPTELIDSFNSSLEELFSSDYLLVVHDLSNPNVENQAKIVFNTLKEVGFSEEILEKKIINIFNKSDLNSNIDNIDIKFKNQSVKTSALTKEGVKNLKNYLDKLVDKNFLDVLFYIPTDSFKISSWLHKNSFVYNDIFCDINFIGHKIKTKISIKKLKYFKSNFAHIRTVSI